MDEIELRRDEATIKITALEAMILNNALNEVCNGLDEFEFETRMGATLEEVKTLLDGIRNLSRQMPVE